MVSSLNERCTEGPDRDYTRSVEYSAAQLLVRYMHICELSSSYIIQRIFNEFVTWPIDDAYIDKIDKAELELNTEEIKAFAKCISTEFGYDEEEFYDYLMEEASFYQNPSNDEKKRLKAQMFRISNITYGLR